MPKKRNRNVIVRSKYSAKPKMFDQNSMAERIFLPNISLIIKKNFCNISVFLVNFLAFFPDTYTQETLLSEKVRSSPNSL